MRQRRIRGGVVVNNIIDISKNGMNDLITSIKTVLIINQIIMATQMRPNKASC